LLKNTPRGRGRFVSIFKFNESVAPSPLACL